MKINLPITGLSLGLLSALNAFGQGALTPPGAPGPTMVTLSQIQPRTPISSVPFTISQPGSYYLTTNVTVSTGNAITISTNGVTLDLNGFTISSTAASATGYGILINSGLRNLTIGNGFIQGGVTNNGSGVYNGSGFSYGIAYSGSVPVNVLVSRISVSGCYNYGIYLYNGDSTVVEFCTVRTVGSFGIFASTIKQSSAVDCGASAIYGDQVSDCRGQCSNVGYGVFGYLTQNCAGYSNSGTGLYAYTTAVNCYGYSYSYTGLDAVNALNSDGNSVNGSGLEAINAQNCYGYCSGSGSGYGIYADDAQNCFGSSGGSGDGIYVIYIASNCFGYCASGTGVNAFIANVCHGVGVTPLSTSHNIYSY